MRWGISLSSFNGELLFYETNSVNSIGAKSTLADIQGKAWQGFLDQIAAKNQFSETLFTGKSQHSWQVGERNAIPCEFSTYLIPNNCQILGLTRWSPSSDLSEREFQVCTLLCDGASPAAISERLGISTSMVSKYKKQAMKAMDCTTEAQLGYKFKGP